uniref:Low-density lipoprotein receptor-related protein 2-like n=1 Tax=Saccoglossus kowalevskii TaxID=10224 RepID=A0ABM0MEI4_SACKO|nr:PREDICTED: low-density lipoprotein receptor-related protein 2-like [Saccoglossus kowalevskii]
MATWCKGLGLVCFLALPWQTISTSCQCPTPNPCENGGQCEGDCGPDGFICFCSSGYTGNRCQTNVGGSGSCGAGEYECSDTSCILATQQCDYYQDCSSGEDETSCSCTGDQFTCNDGRCIPLSRWCDGIRDCSDSEDEVSCSTPADCSDLSSLSNGITMGGWGHGDHMAFVCNSGFTLVGSVALGCTDGSWSGSAPTCLGDCPDQSPPTNGQRIGLLTHGSSLTFICDSGYTLVGAAILTCNDGTWDNTAPSCFADCVDPGTPNNVLRTGGTTHGGVLSYSCVSGYLYGSSDIICDNGVWNDSIPACFDPSPNYHWELSGKCSSSDPDPVDCTGTPCATVYEMIQSRDGNIYDAAPVNFYPIQLTASPPAVVNRHLCSIYNDAQNILFLNDFNGECLSDVYLCPEGATISFWLNIDASVNNGTRYIFSSGGQTAKSRGFAVWTTDGATSTSMVWAAIIRKDRNTLNRHLSSFDWFPQNTWFYLTVTFSTTNLGNIYVDGALQAPTQGTEEMTLDTYDYTSLNLGGPNDDPSSMSERSISAVSELKIHYRELTETEVGWLYDIEMG